MSDRLDRDTAERMLRGEDTGPPKLAALLADASARPLRDDARGEEFAVTAFREARLEAGAPAPAARRRLRSRVLAVKTALIGLLLVLAGGVAVAASPHLPRPLGDSHVPATRTPATPRGAAKRLTAPVPPHTSPRASAKGRPPHTRGHGSRHGHKKEKSHLPKKPLPTGGKIVLPPEDGSPLKLRHPHVLRSHKPHLARTPGRTGTASGV